MNISSQQPIYSITSDSTDTITIGAVGSSDDLFITLPDLNMTTSANPTPYISTATMSGGAGYTYTTLTSDTITFNADEYQFNWGEAEEWVDAFPDWQRIQDMCKKYPGLEIALRNFKTVYTLVKDDYDNPKDEE